MSKNSPSMDKYQKGTVQSWYKILALIFQNWDILRILQMKQPFLMRVTCGRSCGLHWDEL